MTTIRHIARILASASACAAAAAILAGCESDDSDAGNYWTTEQPKPAQTAPATPSKPSTPSSSQSSSASQSSSTASSEPSPAPAAEPAATAAEQTAEAPADPGAADEVPFGALHWSFGGINGGRASKTSASIGHLSARGDSMSYRWTGPTLSSWGLSDGEIGAYACFFVQRADGAWVGGKFDWISTSRTSRGFENINGGYGGWNLAGVPNPCACAFVIISSDCKKRTNVIGGTWSR